eukprot:1242205-Rhodomonas_salina.1
MSVCRTWSRSPWYPQSVPDIPTAPDIPQAAPSKASGQYQVVASAYEDSSMPYASTGLRVARA